MTKVQVAIQGGGAKFIHLLAAASAFQEMQYKGGIKITRVAGTSAGSLVAALLASGTPIQKVNAFLREKGPALVENAMPSTFPTRYKRHTMMVLFKALTGIPLLPEAALRKFIEEMFINARGSAPKTIGDCEEIAGTRLFITTSDIRESCGHVFHPHDFFIDAILSSCAVPFAFRTYKHSELSRYVDGGICDNLPAELLVKNERGYGKTFAISPSQEPEHFPIENPLMYISALFSASINHNVLRSRQMVGASRMITVETDLKIFEFSKMLAQTDSSSQYKINLNSAMKAILAHLNFNRFANAGGEVVDGDVADVRRLSSTTYEIVKKLKGPCRLRVLSHTTSVMAKCLIPRAEDQHSDPDIVRKQLVFQVLDGQMRVLEINLRTEGNVYHLKPTIWSVKNLKDGGKVQGTLLPLFLEEQEKMNHSKCLIIFDEPIMGSADGDMYLCEWIYAVGNCFIGMQKAGSDFIAETNGCGCVIEQMSLIAYLPTEYSQIVNVAVEQQDEHHRQVDCSEQVRNLLDVQTEIGYNPIGARVENVLPRMRVEIKVQRAHLGAVAT